MQEINRFFRGLRTSTHYLTPKLQLPEKNTMKLNEGNLESLSRAIHTTAWQILELDGPKPEIENIRRFLKLEYFAITAEDRICKLTGDNNPTLRREKICLKTAQELDTLGGQNAAISYFGLLIEHLEEEIENPSCTSFRKAILKSKVELFNASIDEISAKSTLPNLPLG